MTLHGKVVVVTGAAGGIGHALCQTFLENGAIVVGADLIVKNLETLQEWAGKYGHSLDMTTIDVTDLTTIRDAISEIKQKHSRIDVWINAAGLAVNKSFNDFDVDEYDRIIDVNLHGVIRCNREVLRLMESQAHGTIINIASVAGHIAPPFMSPYTTAKHGLIGFTKSLQAELDFLDSPVRIMLVSPGFVATPLIAKGEAMGFPEWLKFMLAKPKDVATSIVKAYQNGRNEVYPTLNGKLMLGLHRWLPKTTVKSSRVLLTKSWRDLLLNRYHVK